MQRVVNCELIIERILNSNKEISKINGRGYYKEDNGETTVFFSSDDIKYKYVYRDGVLKVYCGDSSYMFIENSKNIGEIKNGDYIFRITTLASKIEFSNNCIILDYSLYQQELIGTYHSKLSFN